MSTETVARPAATTQTEFTEAEHQLLDAMNVPTNRLGRGLLFREMQRTGLDPFAKHLYLREDWNQKANKNVYAVASTIDGFRIVAARQSSYEGQTAPQWCDKNGNWTESWWVDAPPVAARIGVYVRGYREPMWGIARFTEYKPGGNAGFMWSKMAAHMIAKVAEALAIRKAYPDQLSGVYTDDEMQQADARKDQQAAEGDKPATRHNTPAGDEWETASGQPLQPPAPGVPSATGEQVGEIVRLLGIKRGVYNGQCAGVVSQLVQRRIEHPRTLSQAEARSIIETLTAEQDRVQLPTEPAPVEPTAPPVRMVTEAQKKMIWGTLNRQQQTKYGGHVLMSRILGREITSTNDLTMDEASKVIESLRTGEIPPSEAAPKPSGPNANGEGISEFDAIDQMIRDVASDQARAETEQAITVELGRGTITIEDAGILRERLAEHVRQAKAGASA